MKNFIKLFKSVLISNIILFVLFNHNNLIMASDGITDDIYHEVELNKDTVLGGEDIEVTIRLKNIESIPTSEKAIQSYLGILKYDSTKFSVKTNEQSLDPQYVLVDPTTYERGAYSRVYKTPGGDVNILGYPNEYFVRYHVNYVDYLNIEILFAQDDENVLREDYEVIKITFTAKEDIFGPTTFEMVDSIDAIEAGFTPYKSDKNYQIDNSLTKQNTYVIPKEVNVNQIKVLDINTNNEYIAQKNGLNYEVIIPEDISQIKIIVVTESIDVSITGDGIHPYNGDYSEYEISVKSNESLISNIFNLVVRSAKSINTLDRVEFFESKLFNGESVFLFDQINDEYTFEVKYSNTLKLKLFPTDSNAKIYYLGDEITEIKLENLEPNTEIDIRVTVEAENNSVRAYTLKISILDINLDTSLEYLITDFNDDNIFVEDNEYEIRRKYSSNNKIKFIVKPMNEDAVVSFGNPSLNFWRYEENGEYYYESDEIIITPGLVTQNTIIVTAGTSSSEYKVNLIFANIDSDARLENILINRQELINFNLDKYQYSIGQFPYTTKSISVLPTPKSEYAIVSIDGKQINLIEEELIDLKEGINKILITVKSQPGYFGEQQITRQYELLYHRENPLNHETSLDDILLDGSSLNDFSESMKEYTITVPYYKENVTIEVILSEKSKGAVLIGDLGFRDLSVGENIFSIRVISEDEQNVDEYTIKIYREGKSTNTNIAKILVDNQEVLLEDNEYILEVDYQTDMIFLSVIAIDENASISGEGFKRLITGENVFTITVTAQDDNFTTDYEVKIIRKLPNLNGKLKTIKIDGVEIKDFDSDKYTYSYTVGWEFQYVIIELETIEKSAKILPSRLSSFEQLWNLNYGLNTVRIDVEAEDGSITTYQLSITRNTHISKDSTLKELKVEGYEHFVLQEGDEKITSFLLTVPNKQESITVNAIANSKTAFVVGATSYNLREGLNQIDVVVFAEDKTSSTNYRILVNRESLSNNNHLNDITIKEVPIFSYNPEQEVYYISLEKGISSLTFEIETAHDGAEYEIIGNSNFKVGVNPIEVKVTAVDGSVRSYLIFATIDREDLENPINPEIPETPDKPNTGLVTGLIITTTISIGSVGYIILNVLRRRS